MDLRDWNFEQDGMIPLNGEWEFYWKHLFDPDQIEGKTKEWIEVPKSWGSHHEQGNGYATYRLTLWLPNEEMMMALKLSPISSAYKLWVNGKQVSAVGKVSTERGTSQASYYPNVVPIVTSGETEIVLQVSNYAHVRGGVWQAIQLGRYEQVVKLDKRAVSMDMLLFGSLAMIGIYHLGLFYYRSKDKSTLYFGIFCLLASLRNLLVSEALLYQMFPGFPWELGLKLEYIAYYLSVPLGVMFVQTVIPNYLSQVFFRMIQILGAGFSLFVLFTPSYVFTGVNSWYQWITIATIIYVLCALVRATKEKKQEAALLLTGAMFYSATVILDVLFYKEVISSGDFASMGLFVGVLIQSLTLAKRFSKAFMREEEMSLQLKVMNDELEQKVKDRTKKLEQMERERRNLLSNISHDLKTPMTLILGYVEALANNVVEEPELQKKYLQVIYQRVQGLNRLVEDLFELSKLEMGIKQFVLNTMPVKQMIEHFAYKYELEVVSTGYLYRAEIDDAILKPENNDYMIEADLSRLDQLFTNLIHNALKYMNREKGEGIVSLHFKIQSHLAAKSESEAYIIIELHDNGVGIDQADLPFIFDRFYKKDRAGNASYRSSGLGLAISKAIVEGHQGTIQVHSESGKGTSFFMSFPIFR